MKTNALVTTILLGTFSLPFGSLLGQSELSNLRFKNAQQKKHIEALEGEVERLYILLDRETKRTGAPKIARTPINKTLRSGATYTVKSGDTLSRISRHHNVSLSSLMISNNLNSRSVLHIGQKIVIPGKIQNAVVVKEPKKTVIKKIATSKPTTAKTYSVTSGDTLYGIARKCDTTVSNILAVNPNLTSRSTLYIGQKINVAGTAPISKYKAPQATPKQLPPLPALTNNSSKKSAVIKQKPVVKYVPVKKAPVKSTLPKLPETEYLTQDIVFSDFARKHNTTVAQLNKINGWNYPPSTVLARESEIFLPQR